MSPRLAGQKRSRWPGRVVFWVAASAAIAGLAWLHAPSRTRLAAITDRVVAGLLLVDPSLSADYFLLQATLCPWRYGFSCAPEGQPRNIKVVPGRRTIDPRSPASRRQAREAIDAEFKGSASWSTVAKASPGAAVHTLWFLARSGWGVWLAWTICVMAATALVFSVLDASVAALVVAVAAAAGVAWLLAMALAPLAAAGWAPQFVTLVSVTGLSVMQLRDLYLVSALHQRAEFRRRRLQLERLE